MNAGWGLPLQQLRDQEEGEEEPPPMAPADSEQEPGRAGGDAGTSEGCAGLGAQPRLPGRPEGPEAPPALRKGR